MAVSNSVLMNETLFFKWKWTFGQAPPSEMEWNDL